MLPAEQVLTQATNVLQLRNFMDAMHVDAYRIYSFLTKKWKPFIQGKGNSSQLSDNQRFMALISKDVMIDDVHIIYGETLKPHS